MSRNDSPILTFTEHLEELRTRLFVCIITLVITTLIGLAIARPLLKFLINPLQHAARFDKESLLQIKIDPDGNLRLAQPLHNDQLKHLSRFRIQFLSSDNPPQKFVFGPDYRSNLYYFSPADPIILILKAALISGIILALPIILFQAWLFIRPALTSRERKYAKPLLLAALLLFPIGAAFAYYLLRFALGLFFKYAILGLEPRLNAFYYLNFSLTLMIISGFVFEFPLIILFLTRIGILSTRFLRKYRGHAIVIIVLSSALITPPDVITQIALSVPLAILYEISIWLATLLEKKHLESGLENSH
jgi:sec-independent protein translocase protein TatC